MTIAHRICIAAVLLMSRQAIGVEGPNPMTWPNDADGGVFRSLQRHKFDFSHEYSVEFNVDFDHWPPSETALSELEKRYGHLAKHPPSGGDVGHVQFRIFHRLSYEWVIQIQREASNLMKPYGGVCESWGVMAPP